MHDTVWFEIQGLPAVSIASSEFAEAAETQRSALGMKDAFSRASDFSGMDGQQDLYIDKILHKAFVDVNEEGTEAAAATAVVMGIKAVMHPVTFRADHPFLFLIREKNAGSILFMGRVADPTQAGE